MRLDEGLVMPFAGLGAVSVFFGGVIVFSMLFASFDLLSLGGVLGLSFLVLGLCVVGYALMFSSRRRLVLLVSVVIVVGGVLSNMSYDYSSRLREGSSFRFSVVDASGRSRALGFKVPFNLFSVSQDLGRYAELFCDARLRWTYPPKVLPDPVYFRVECATYVDPDGDGVYGLYRTFSQNPVLDRWVRVREPGSEVLGWRRESETVAVAQTDRIPVFTISGVDSIFEVSSRVKYRFRIYVHTRVGELSYLVESPAYEFYIALERVSADNIRFLGSGPW